MVRRDLRLWLGVAGFGVLVAVLALIAANRDRGVEFDGRWDLVHVEIFGTTLEPDGPSWVVFDNGSIQAAGNCFELQGLYSVGSSGFRMDEWGSSSSCADPISDAYQEFWGTADNVSVDAGILIFQNVEGSVRFSYGRSSG